MAFFPKADAPTVQSCCRNNSSHNDIKFPLPCDEFSGICSKPIPN